MPCAQFPRVKALLLKWHSGAEVPSFEADDIRHLVTACEPVLPALLVTGDWDALQLVTDKTHVLYTKRGISDTVEFDPGRWKPTASPRAGAGPEGADGDRPTTSLACWAWRNIAEAAL